MKYLAHALLLLLPASATAAELYKYVPDEIRQNVEVRSDWSRPYLDNMASATRIFSANEEPITKHELSIATNTIKFPIKITDASLYYAWLQEIPPNTVDTNTPMKWEGQLTTQLGHNNIISPPLKFGSYFEGYLNIGDFTVTDSTGHFLTARCPVPEYVYADEFFREDIFRASHSANYTGSGIYGLKTTMECRITYRIVPELQLEIEKPVMDIGASDIETTHENRIKSTGFGGRGVVARLTIENPNTNDVQVAFSKSNLEVTEAYVVPNRYGAWKNFYVKLKRKQPGSYQYNINFTASYD
ncbi:TPA: hypothetical protein JS362_005063 [Escherichia coli]|nr:hypothetical protein [Escherichia coli]